MRAIGLLLMALISAGWWACAWDDPTAVGAAPRQAEWRRTVRGWETRDTWDIPRPPAAPPLHPAILAAAEVLTAVLILLAAHAPLRRHSLPAGKLRIFSPDSCTDWRSGPHY